MANGLLGLIAQPQIADIQGSFAQGRQEAQAQQELQRQQQARGLAGAALQQQFGGQLGELAAVDPALAQQVFQSQQVVGQARQKQFTEDVRVAANLAQTDPLQARGFIEQAIQRNEQRGISSPQMRQFLTEFDQDPARGAQTLQQLNQALSLAAPAERELRVKERGVELREQEIGQRALDREAANQARREGLELRKAESEIRQLQLQSQRETNTIKKQELERQISQQQRDTQFEATNAVDTVESSIATVDRLLTGEGLEEAAGISAAFPTLPGTAAADFEAEIESLKSQAFLTQVEKMKGLGALSENEGKKLADAVGALSLSQSDKALRASLNRIQVTLNGAKRKIEKKFNVQAGVSGDQTQNGAALRLEDLSATDLRNLTDEQLQALISGGQ